MGRPREPSQVTAAPPGVSVTDETTATAVAAADTVRSQTFCMGVHSEVGTRHPHNEDRAVVSEDVFSAVSVDDGLKVSFFFRVFSGA